MNEKKMNKEYNKNRLMKIIVDKNDTQLSKQLLCGWLSDREKDDAIYKELIDVCNRETQEWEKGAMLIQSHVDNKK